MALPPYMRGTRTSQTTLQGASTSSGVTRSLNTDKGLNKLVTAAITFVAASKQLQAANGTFNNFAVNDAILVEGTNLNNGIFTVAAIDAVNHAFLTVINPPKNEGPLSASVRAI